VLKVIKKQIDQREEGKKKDVIMADKDTNQDTENERLL